MEGILFTSVGTVTAGTGATTLAVAGIDGNTAGVTDGMGTGDLGVHPGTCARYGAHAGSLHVNAPTYPASEHAINVAVSVGTPHCAITQAEGSIDGTIWPRCVPRCILGYPFPLFMPRAKYAITANAPSASTGLLLTHWLNPLAEHPMTDGVVSTMVGRGWLNGEGWP